MGISKQPPKPFPITKGLPCQLKWTHSTVYLTDGVSATFITFVPNSKQEEKCCVVNGLAGVVSTANT